jgi:hypothetical protein
MFEATHVTVKRLALNPDQVRQYNPPPNPAKITDSRARSYIAQYGRESWELDALDPKVIDGLIREAIIEVLDDELWEAALDRQNAARTQLAGVAAKWPDIVKMTDGE